MLMKDAFYACACGGLFKNIPDKLAHEKGCDKIFKGYRLIRFRFPSKRQNLRAIIRLWGGRDGGE